MNRVYLSPSNQTANIGKLGYNEATDMRKLAAKVMEYLDITHEFIVFMSDPNWSRDRVVLDSNNQRVDIHVSIHSDATGTAAPGGGTTVFSYGQSGKGREMANLLYKYVAPLSPKADHGVNSRPGLQELNSTNAPAALIECFFHTNEEEVTFFRSNFNKFAAAIAHAICDYFGVPFTEPKGIPQYKIDGAQFLLDAGYTSSLHDPLEPVDIGLLGAILRNKKG